MTITTLVDRLLVIRPAVLTYDRERERQRERERERERVRKNPVYSYLLNFSSCKKLSSSLYLAVTPRIHGKVFSITEYVYVKCPSLSKVP